MATVVDSSVLIDHLRDEPAARALVSEAVAGGETLYASLITRIEVRAGMVAEQRRRTQVLFQALEWVSISDGIAEIAGDFAARYGRSHAGIDAADYLIAATSSFLGADLWTRNVRHFPMFADLRPPY